MNILKSNLAEEKHQALTEKQSSLEDFNYLMYVEKLLSQDWKYQVSSWNALGMTFLL